MLHLLPESYIQELQKEYNQRVLVTCAKLISFCLFVLSIGLIPSLVLLRSEQIELRKQSNAITLRISDEDKAIATEFKSAVNRGISTLKASSTITSLDIEQLAILRYTGIRINTFNSAYSEDGQEAELQGVADNRSDLSAFVRIINAAGVYIVDEVPVETFKKDKDLDFDLILRKNTNQVSQ